ELANLPAAACFLLAQNARRLGGVLHAQHFEDRVFAAADQANAAHIENHVALVKETTPCIGVAVAQSVLDLLKRYALLPEQVGIRVDFVTSYGAPAASNISNARNAAKFPL